MYNPILNNKFTEHERVLQVEPMTVNGTIQITFFLSILLILSAAFVWSRFSLGYTDLAFMLTTGGTLLGLALGFIIIFTKNKVLIPVYAVCEGCLLGGFSAIMENSYPGIATQAIAGTLVALLSMLIMYKANLIKCTDKFRSTIFIATSSIAAIYFIDIIGHFFGYAIPLINSSSNFGIFFSLVIIVIASLNFIINFDYIEKGSQAMLPKDFEW